MRRSIVVWLLAGAFTSACVGPASAGAPDLMRLHRGGTLRLVAKGAAGSVDPQINYTAQFWQLFAICYDGLLAYRKAPGAAGEAIVPDLAESLPELQDGGRTYLFHLRRGVRFSDGREVTARDVVASFRRLFRVSSPTSGSFFRGIVGAEACLRDPASCRLEGVSGDDAAGTVTIRLVAPDAEFPAKLSLPHASILPADAPAHDAGILPIPGTGPYLVAAYDPNGRMRIVRNPRFQAWSGEAQPDGYVDEIDYDFGLDDEEEVTAVENGQADWCFDQPPLDRLAELGTRYASRVHLHTLFAMWYLAMNTRLAPFDHPLVRQAVNYALDRAAAANLFGGPRLATPACRILPPGLAGHRDDCPYTRDPGGAWTAPDMARALALVRASGTAGQRVTLITDDTAAPRAIGTYVQSLLRQLGYDARLRTLSESVEFTYIQNTANRVQISLTTWYADYPAPSDFLSVLFGCGSFHPDSDSSVNISGFCDHGIDQAMAAAQRAALTDGAEADRRWAAIDGAVTAAAPAAVLFTPKYLDFVSERLGNYVYSPVFHFLLSSVWVR